MDAAVVEAEVVLEDGDDVWRLGAGGGVGGGGGVCAEPPQDEARPHEPLWAKNKVFFKSVTIHHVYYILQILISSIFLLLVNNFS